MKKILFAAVAVVAMTFAACGGNKEQAADAIDAQAVAQMTDATEVEGAANKAVEALKTQLANADKAQLEAVMAKAIEAAQGLLNNGNAEGAAQYVQTVVTFVKENKENLQALGIDVNNILPQTLVDAATAATPQVQQAQEVLENAQEAVENLPDDVKETATKAAEQVVNDGAKQLNDAANKAVNDAAQEVLRNIPGAK